MSDTIVVDLGCCPHDGDVSIGRLIERYRPKTLFGFDPLLEMEEKSYRTENTDVFLERKAAWTEDGVGVLGVGANSLLNATMLADKKNEGEWKREVEIQLFDFGFWLQELQGDERLIVKMNIEGAEFPLLQDLYRRNLDLLIDLLHVSWHDDRMGLSYAMMRESLEKQLRCEIQTWTLW